MGVFLDKEFRSGLAESEQWLVDIFSDGAKSYTGKAVNEKSSLQYTAVYRCVTLLANTLATVPLKFYKRLPGGGKEEVPNHPLYRVLNLSPNPEMTSFTFRQTLMGHLGTWGNAYANIEYDKGGRIKALWPLRPDRMFVRRAGKDLLYEYYHKGEIAKLRPYEILHIPGFGFNGLVGYSPISLVRQAIALGLATEEYGARFFANNARPGGYLKHPGKLSPDAYKRLRKYITKRHEGLTNAHRLGILEEGMEFQEVGIPFEDKKFLQTRKFQVTEIARFYGIPPHKIADLEKSSFNNIEQQSIEYVVDAVLPWVTLWEQSLSLKLLSSFEQDQYLPKFILMGLLRGDIKSRFEAYNIGLNTGFLNDDEVRDWEELNPKPNGAGKKYYKPLNWVPEDQATQIEEKKSRELRSKRSAGSRLKIRNSYKRLFKDAAGRVTRREVNDLKRGINKHIQNLEELDSWFESFYRDHKTFIKRHMKPVFVSFTEAIQAEAAKEVNSEEEIPDFEKFVNSYIDTFIEKHCEKSLGQLRKIVKENKRSTRSDDNLEVKGALENRLDEWEDKRPDKVAEREAVQCDSAVAVFTYASAGVRKIRWVTNGKNCPLCNKLNGKVVGIESYFALQGDTIKAEGVNPLTVSYNTKHPQLHRGCDCSIIAS